MAIDLYSQEKEEPTWKKVLLLISIIIVTIVIIIFVVQKFFTIPGNANKMIELRTQINTQGNAEQLAQKEKVLSAEEKIKTFKNIYINSPVFDVFFTDFEEWIYPRVYFTNFKLDASGKLELTGQTDTLQSLMQQMIVFDSQNNITNYEISNIATNDDNTEVTFDALININPQIFKKTEDSYMTSSIINKISSNVK